ncbi:unnamed protein product [Musa acuminata var. zebrina]
MVSDDPSTTINESNVATESTVGGKKNQSGVPKKIHKAEREKLKRDQLNELFLVVGHNQTDKTIVRLPYWVILPQYSDISSRIYQWATHMAVATERNELKDENTTLQAEISQLQKELQGRSSYDPTWSENINSMTPTQPQPTATGLPMLHRPLQHFSGGKNKHSTTNAAWAFPGDETTCRISDFVGLAVGSSPLDFSPESQEERCGSCGISASSEEEGCNKASTGCGANSASASHGGGPHAEPAAPQCSCSYRQPSD